MIRFMGTYSGRLLLPDEETVALTSGEKSLISTLGSDIGLVWRNVLIEEILR